MKIKDCLERNQYAGFHWPRSWRKAVGRVYPSGYFVGVEHGKNWSVYRYHEVNGYIDAEMGCTSHEEAKAEARRLHFATPRLTSLMS